MSMPAPEPELNELQRTQFRGLIDNILDPLIAQRNALNTKIQTLESVRDLYATEDAPPDSAAPKAAAKNPEKRARRVAPTSKNPITKPHAPPRSPHPDGKLLSVAQVAGRVGTHITTIYTEIKVGRLNPINEQRPAMFTQEEFARWFAARTSKGTAP